MAYKTGVDYLLGKLGERKTTAINAVITGSHSYDEYKRLCGFIDGLELAENLVCELEKRLMDAEDAIPND